jgi:3-oxoacyl-[acyl-carrier-protein] synthase-3
VRNAVVIGVELISPYMDWSNRGVAVLFGDGCAAVVLQATDEPVGLLGEKLGCYADARQTLRVRGMGCTYANRGLTLGDTQWDFDGQEIFKRAVHGMGHAAEDVLKKCGVSAAEVDIVVPHQANLRIIESVVKRIHLPMDKVMLTVQRYGNMSAATVPVALVEALEQGRVEPGALLLMPAFGAGLTLCAHLVRWGDRVTPLGTTDIDLPPCTKSALEMVNEIRAIKAEAVQRSGAALMAPKLAETLGVVGALAHA